MSCIDIAETINIWIEKLFKYLQAYGIRANRNCFNCYVKYAFNFGSTAKELILDNWLKREERVDG